MRAKQMVWTGRATAVALLLLAGPDARAQAPEPLAPAAVPDALPGVVGQAPIAAGNTASARERALDEAFRLLVEKAFADLLAETGVATPSPGQAALRVSWLQRPRRLVRGYKVLEQSEQDGMLRVRVTAELDEAGMRRELERARGAAAGAGSKVTAGALPVVAIGTPEAAGALAAALSAAGVRAEAAPGRFTDEAAIRAHAQKVPRGQALAVNGRDEEEGLVRGTAVRAVSCEVSARVYTPSESGGEKTARARGFGADAREARTSCYARASASLAPGLTPDLGGGAPAGDLRVVLLDLDLTEPAVLSPLLRAVRKLAGPAGAEIRRVAVGRVELAVNTRLAPASLLTGLTRELAAVATLERTGADRGDRVSGRIRLLAPSAAPSFGPQPAPPTAGPGT